MGALKAIAAMSQNRVIGSRGRVPWHLPEDLAWFKKLTTGHVVLMGRKTFESIGGPLPDRVTIVLSRSLRELPGARIISSISDLDLAGEARDVFVCGGAQVYADLLPRCSELFLTLVKRNVEGDSFFPSFEEQFVPVETLLERPDFRITHYRRSSGSNYPMKL